MRGGDSQEAHWFAEVTSYSYSFLVIPIGRSYLPEESNPFYQGSSISALPFWALPTLLLLPFVAGILLSLLNALFHLTSLPLHLLHLPWAPKATSRLRTEY